MLSGPPTDRPSLNAHPRQVELKLARDKLHRRSLFRSDNCQRDETSVIFTVLPGLAASCSLTGDKALAVSWGRLQLKIKSIHKFQFRAAGRVWSTAAVLRTTNAAMISSWRAGEQIAPTQTLSGCLIQGITGKPKVTDNKTDSRKVSCHLWTKQTWAP